MTDHKQQLETKLWNIADLLRGKMSSDEYKDYILGFIFYKYLSENFILNANKFLKDTYPEEKMDYLNLEEEDRKSIKATLINLNGYYLETNELFSYIVSKGKNKEEGLSNFIIEDLSNIFKNIENSTTEESEDDFKGLFNELDLNSSKLGKKSEDRNEILVKILTYLSEIDFELNNTEIDVLGDAYEYMIGQFASAAGKKGGEFYTPQSVSTILSKIVTVGKDKLKNVYDPTCGSGSLLLRVAREFGKENKKIGTFYGQELNSTTYNLARMNMILHGVKYQDFNIENEDTLEHPKHLDKRFEAIVANPPYSINWEANVLKETDERFSGYGKLAPKTKADLAFVQHMVYQLDDEGTMAVVLPHGVLFRLSGEKTIRQKLIDDNLLDSVIGLPANLFYGTSIPTCILVFKKCRKEGEGILFIDGSKHFEKSKNQNSLREDDIEKLMEVYKGKKEEDKYSHIASIKENDYNLNIPRYVDTFEEEEVIDIEEVANEIIKLEDEGKKIDEEISGYCKELGIKSPFITNIK